jgi:hypothetical protein
MKFSAAISFLLVGTAAAFAPAPVAHKSSSVRDSQMVVRH